MSSLTNVSTLLLISSRMDALNSWLLIVHRSAPSPASQSMHTKRLRCFTWFIERGAAKSSVAKESLRLDWSRCWRGPTPDKGSGRIEPHQLRRLLRERVAGSCGVNFPFHQRAPTAACAWLEEIAATAGFLCGRGSFNIGQCCACLLFVWGKCRVFVTRERFWLFRAAACARYHAYSSDGHTREL